MSISVPCPCGKTLVAPDTLAGRQARCAACGRVLDVPAPSEIPTLLSQTEVRRRTPLTPQELFERVGPTVVTVKLADGNGSGFFLRPDLVATNWHVVRGTHQAIVKLKDGRELPASVMRSFRDDDIAFLKVEGAGCPAVACGRSDGLKVGQAVHAIGAPRGFENTLTQGVVSAVDRVVEGRPFIQTDAPINPGNSGGPLFNEFAEVIGMNTWIVGGATGLGFSIPIDAILKRLDEATSVAPPAGARYCVVCGRMSSAPKYCEHCGSELATSAAPASPAPAAPAAGGRACPVCRKETSASTYCEHCGSALPAETAPAAPSAAPVAATAAPSACPACRRPLSGPTRYCPNCGTTVT
jgi:hypothetical protein